MTTTKQKPDSLTLTVRTACDLVGISRSTLLRLIARGEFPQPRRVGAKVLFDRAEVVAWWQKQGSTD